MSAACGDPSCRCHIRYRFGEGWRIGNEANGGGRVGISDEQRREEARDRQRRYRAQKKNTDERSNR